MACSAGTTPIKKVASDAIAAAKRKTRISMEVSMYHGRRHLDSQGLDPPVTLTADSRYSPDNCSQHSSNRLSMNNCWINRPARRAQRQSRCQFPFSRRATRHQQACEVQTGEQQDSSAHREHGQQRLAKRRANMVNPLRARHRHEMVVRLLFVAIQSASETCSRRSASKARVKRRSPAAGSLQA